MEHLYKPNHNDIPHKHSENPELSDRYRIISEIGHGSQGEVYRAERKSDQTTVAIKVLRIDSIQNWKEYDLFWREVETLKSLDIDGVARFYEVIEQLDAPKPCAYLVQQYISGKSLAEMIRNGYRFDIKTVFEIALQIVDILEKLHHHDPPIIHRDLKPSNIMIETDKAGFRVYLIDFGAVANPLLQKGGSTVAGTYGYMPPEQLMGKPVPASDIYALGATLAGLLGGMEPGEMEVADYRLAIEKPLENLPHSIVSCLRQMTQPKIENRLCDYTQLRAFFTLFAKGEFFKNPDKNLPVKSTRDFYKRLKDVHVLGRHENFELWNELPETTPRKIPWFYKKTKKYDDGIIYVLLKLIQFKHFEHKFTPSFLLYSPLGWFAFLILLLFILCLNIITIFVIIIPALIVFATIFLYLPLSKIHLFNFLLIDTHLDKIFNGWPCTIDLVFAAIYLSFLIGSISMIYSIIKRKNPKIKKEKQLKNVFFYLLKNGRKTLAKVQQVNFIGLAQPSKGKVFPSTIEVDDSILDGINDPCTYLGLYDPYYPRIEIIYAFNPPDDSSSETLVHSIIVPADSEKTISPGDYLPILYTIDKDDNSIVHSMPFPMPMHEYMNLEEMIYVQRQTNDT